jgi:hypothetical protein
MSSCCGRVFDPSHEGMMTAVGVDFNSKADSPASYGVDGDQGWI